MNDIITYAILGVIVVLIVAYFVWAIKRMVRDAREGVRDVQAFFTSVPKPAEPKAPRNAFLESRFGQRLLGVLLGVGGVVATVWLWNGAMQGEGVRIFAAVMFPVFGVLGLGLLLFPLDADAQRCKYGTAKPRTWNEFPLPMKISAAVSVLAGVGNLAALYVITR